MAYHGYVCPIPYGDCGGTSDKEKNGLKYHENERDLLRCKENHLRKKGFVKVGTRQWRDPEGGILVLDRHPGKRARMRKGKEGRSMREFHTVVGW